MFWKFEIYADFYQELPAKATEIADIIDQEEKKFRQSMQRGLREFEKMIVGKDQLTAELAFKLYESYGFPFELSIEEAKGEYVDLVVFQSSRRYISGDIFFSIWSLSGLLWTGFPMG